MLAGENDKPGVEERYSTAVSSSNLAVNPRTSMSDTDVLGAMGIADRELTEGKARRRNKDTGEMEEEAIKPAPLAVALERLLTGGDNRAAHAIVRALADSVWREARGQKVKLTHADATEMARAVLAWYRHGVCKPCGGHGFELIPGTRTHGETRCDTCKGSGKRSLEREFKPPMRPLVTWLAAEIQREAGRAGPRAMAHLAARMEL
jgi:hypothetical protein